MYIVGICPVYGPVYSSCSLLTHPEMCCCSETSNKVLTITRQHSVHLSSCPTSQLNLGDALDQIEQAYRQNPGGIPQKMDYGGLKM